MMRRLLLIITLIFVTAAICPAQNAKEQESRKQRLEKEIKILEDQLKDNSSKSSNALANIKIISQKESARKALLEESDRQIAALDDSLKLCTIEIKNIRSRLDTMTLYYNKLIKNAYKNRDAKVWYMYLLASDDLNQAAKRFTYLKNLSGQMNIQAGKIKEAQSELETKLANLKNLRSSAETLRKSRKLELDRLKQEENQTRKLVSQLNSQKNKYQKELSSKKKQVEALNKEIQKIIAAAKKSSKNAPADIALAKEFSSNKGKLPWPADGPVADRFGRHNHPVYKSLVMPFNNGINVSVAKDTPIKAVFDGTVSKVIVMPGYNKCVLVEHGNYFTFYCKLSSVSVKAGDKLKTGQTIGIVDTIDGLTQFHFQLWEGTTPRDPELWLRPKD